MNQRIEHDGHVLEITTAMIDVSTQLPQRDPRWTFTDAAGHSHAFGTDTEPYPTLVRREGEPEWDDDLEDEIAERWFECPQCGEKITPGTYVDSSTKLIPGRKSATIDGREVSGDEAEAFITAWEAARVNP